MTRLIFCIAVAHHLQQEEHGRVHESLFAASERPWRQQHTQRVTRAQCTVWGFYAYDVCTAANATKLFGKGI